MGYATSLLSLRKESRFNAIYLGRSPTDDTCDDRSHTIAILVFLLIFHYGNASGYKGAQPHDVANGDRMGQNCSSMNAIRPAASKFSGILRITLGKVTHMNSPHTLHGGKPGDGGTGPPTGALVTGGGATGLCVIEGHSRKVQKTPKPLDRIVPL